MIRSRHVYGDNPHADILLHVGRPRLLLDVGCSTGAFGALIKRETGARVIGVEPHGDAAAKAGTRLDRIIHGLYPECVAGLDERPDLVTFLDVLEHMVDPWQALSATVPLLAEGGRVLALIPNIQNASISIPLLLGHWAYQESGPLDITHLRFFTRESALHLFESRGFRATSIVPFGLAASMKARVSRWLFPRVFTGLTATHWLVVAEVA